MNRRGQVWIETVIYTLIGLALIALVLAFLAPQLKQQSDKALVQQSINVLSTIDSKVNTVLQRGPGNVRPMELSLKQGTLYINGTGDEIDLVLSGLSSTYSEPGVVVHVGRIDVLTVKGQKTNTVHLSINYKGIGNVTFDGSKDVKEITSAPTSYNLVVSNEGSSNGIPEIRFGLS